jgi:hypothetical protein
MANRVQSSTGSCNVRWRREPGGGNTDPPEADKLRVSAEKAEREKLNDERGNKATTCQPVKPCENPFATNRIKGLLHFASVGRVARKSGIVTRCLSEKGGLLSE